VELPDLVRRAIDRRAELITRLDREGTDCLRLFHGVAEGAPGITVDRYGPILLVQTGREPLEHAVLDAIARVATDAIGELSVVWNHRPAFQAEGFERYFTSDLQSQPWGREAGLRFDVRPRHRGLDPLLFLDLRAGRRAIAALGARSVLNLFSYTCAVGVVAAAAGAREVWNVDVAASALSVGAINAAANQQLGPWFLPSSRARSISSCSIHPGSPKAATEPSTWSATMPLCSIRRCGSQLRKEPCWRLITFPERPAPSSRRSSSAVRESPVAISSHSRFLGPTRISPRSTAKLRSKSPSPASLDRALRAGVP
jgi:hypothetical protein